MSEPFNGMSLFTLIGERKYLSGPERIRFYDSLDALDDPKDRTFCKMLYWTGCRPSEALGMSALSIDLSEVMVIIRSLKKHGKMKGRHFRCVPLRNEFIQELDAVHGLHEAQARSDHGAGTPLWRFSRTTGWRRCNKVMSAAGISGVKASARGLRHTLGVHAAVTMIPESRIQTWLGHESLETTGIYLTAIGPEDRAIARRMW